MTAGKETPADRTIPKRSKWKRRERFSLLEAWYGRSRAEVEIANHTCQPEIIGGLLDEVLDSTRNKEDGALVKLHSAWESVIGAEFARYTSPVSLKNGILTMSVRHSALLLELKPSLDIFRDAVNRAAGENVCTEIRLTTGK